jgi:hypothetical protein
MNIMIPIKKEIQDPPTTRSMTFRAEKGGDFKSCPRVPKLGIKNIRIPHPNKIGDTPYPTSDMTSEGLGETLKGDSADTISRKYPLVSIGG